MTASRRLRRFDVLRFVVFYFPLFLSLPALAQGLNLSGAANCTAADFDANLEFVNGPGDYYSIVVRKRNISAHPCVFDGSMYGPSFVPERVEGHEPYKLCYDCENRLPNGQTPIAPAITLNPGEVARQTFRWRTTSSNEAAPCLEPKWMSNPVLLVAPSLLKKVCSAIEVSLFSLAASDGAQAESGEYNPAPAFELTAQKALYYKGELFPLRLSRAHADTHTGAREDQCPTLYLRQRSPDGATRIDELQPLAFRGCEMHVLGHEPGDWKSGFDVDSGAMSRWSGVGEHTMGVFQLVNSADDPQLRFASSNILKIQFVDPTTIPRKWGPRVKGLAADLTLDKQTFTVGEDVSLHMAIENFDAAVPVYSWDGTWDPCMVVGIEVQDAGGKSLPVGERFPSWSICTGHGFGPRPVAKGKVVPLERTLGREGWLPKDPGTYTVVITWAPCFVPKNDAAGQPANLKPYAVAHAMATIHVVADNGSHLN